MSECEEEISYTIGSGNVFADLGFAEPEEMQLRAALIYQISTVIGQRKLTQVQAAQILGVDQPKISALLRGRVTGFSVERLLRFLLALDRNVEIVVREKPTTQARGEVKVTAA